MEPLDPEGGRGSNRSGEGNDVISRAESSVEGGGGLPHKTKWRKCRVFSLRVAKL
jgi:hypothetical protein